MVGDNGTEFDVLLVPIGVFSFLLIFLICLSVKKHAQLKHAAEQDSWSL